MDPVLRANIANQAINALFGHKSNIVATLALYIYKKKMESSLIKNDILHTIKSKSKLINCKNY